MRCLVALALIAAAGPAAQVRQSQTISATAGGFAGPLADGDRFGVAAACPGDLDGDGVRDLVVGAYGDREGRGAAWVLFLNPDGTVRQSRAVRLAETVPGDLFGTSVAALGDLDGDGAPEIAVGADHADGGGTDRGVVWIVSLAPDGAVLRAQPIDAERGGLADGPADGDLFGHGVAALGDFDGDGTPDLVVGADDAGDGGPKRGAVWVLFLRPDGTVRQSQRVSGTAGGFGGALDDGDLFGQDVARVGDLDGDGLPELAVAATGDDDGAPDVGAVWVLFLRSDGTVRAHQKISATAGGFAGPLDSGDVFGSSLVGPGDLDGDGVPDLIVGAGGDDDGGPNRGAGWILFLRQDGTVRDAQKISATAGGAAGPFADGDGWSPRAALGDLDGDGGADFVWGARLADDGGPTRGAARILFTGYAVASAPPPGRAPLRLFVSSPARTTATVSFETDAPGVVSLWVFDAQGRRIAALADGLEVAGDHRVQVDVSGWPAGLYLVRLRVGDRVAGRPLVVIH